MEVTGTLIEGETITAVYTITDSDGYTAGSEAVTWYHVSNPSTPIGSENNYVITAADTGEQIAFDVFTDDAGNQELSDLTTIFTIAALTTNTTDNLGLSTSTTTDFPSTSTTETVAEPTQEPIYNDPYLEPNYDPTLNANYDPMLIVL